MLISLNKILYVAVDGVLTDGTILVSSDGSFIKRFNKEDFHYLKKWQKRGYYVVIMTSYKDDCIFHEFHSLDNYFKTNSILLNDVDNKHSKLDLMLQRWGLNWNKVVSIGCYDDDLEIMERSRKSACPSNCGKEVKDGNVSYVLNVNSGKGLIREFYEIMEQLNDF